MGPSRGRVVSRENAEWVWGALRSRNQPSVVLVLVPGKALTGCPTGLLLSRWAAALDSHRLPVSPFSLPSHQGCISSSCLFAEICTEIKPIKLSAPFPRLLPCQPMSWQPAIETLLFRLHGEHLFPFLNLLKMKWARCLLRRAVRGAKACRHVPYLLGLALPLEFRKPVGQGPGFWKEQPWERGREREGTNGSLVFSFLGSFSS